MMKSLFVTITIAAFALAGCTKTEVTKPGTADANQIAVDTRSAGGGPSYRFYINTDGDAHYDCLPISDDCFETIVIKPSEVVATGIDNIITSGNLEDVANFFNGDHEDIWPDLDGTYLSKLQDGTVTLSRYQDGDEVFYFCVDPDDLSTVNALKRGSEEDMEEVVEHTEFLLRLTLVEE